MAVGVRTGGPGVFTCRSGVMCNEPGQVVTKGMARFEVNKGTYSGKKRKKL